ncbi:hypothetical protein HanHA300_Chr13g0493501 [Helianthus annuus]|nr:hypothetical protein HanHA300_Chr13g0493501 [Helianthus annuus]KAJ0498697.1 hypothetical protein HanHA89_Chr13g0525591 [Helianthus annuus]KAJ0664711.1 hypothetical protein HanLR1_Chr13g0495591 [Helianthus annuus]KAJ0672160.1 hypothetical protein HanOQP8_Chr13g0493891 [Helianthus annuus]
MTSFGVEPGELMGKASPGQEHDTRFWGTIFTRKHGEMTPIIGSEDLLVGNRWRQDSNPRLVLEVVLHLYQ